MDKDNQDHKKLRATSGGQGHEGHGVHLCHQCGWPFPNPHPSAKNRRAHKKVCGTVEGYTLAGSGSESVDPAVTVSDDDNLSDDDRRTPSPKHKEKSNNGKNSVGIGEVSNRSEDEVFTDAVTEFHESGFAPGIEERRNDTRIVARDVEKNGEKDFTVFHSFKDNAVADIIERSNNSTDSDQMQIPEVPENATALPENNPESQVHVSSTSEESAAILTDDNSKKAGDFQAVEPETTMLVSQEYEVMNASDAVRDGLMTYAGQEIDVKGNDEINSEHKIAPFSSSEYLGQTSKVESKCSEIEDITSDPMSAAEVVLSKEDNGAELVSKTPLGDPIPILESVELSDATDTAQHKVGDECGLNFASSVNSMEDFSEKGEGNENVYELSVPADIPVVENAESMLGEFKDHKRLKLHQPVTLDSAETIQDKKDDFENPVSIEGLCNLQTIQLSEVSKVPASDMHAVEDNLVNHSQMDVVGNPSTEGESDQCQIELTSNDGPDEFGSPAEAIKVGMEQHNPVSSTENQQLSEVSDNSLHVCAQETAVIVSHDANPVVTSSDTNVIGLHDAGDHENLATEICDVVGKDEKEMVKEEDYAKNMITTSESDTNLPEFQVNPAIGLSESGDAGDHEEDKIEKCVGVEVESKEENSEEKLLLGTKTGFESDRNLHESQAIDEDKMDVSSMKLPEANLTNIKGVLAIPDSSKQLEVKGNCEAQGEFNAEHGRNIDSLGRTSEDHATKAPLLSDTESSMQASVVYNSYARERGTGDSGIDQALRGENNSNNLVKHQLGASAIDVSVDSSSQTDSLEGNWGSVSVLSTQSDIPAFVEAEALASAEAERWNSTKPESTTERQHSAKSDIFEAPSFMTLVEPGSGSKQKAAASDIDTAQKLDEKKAQAGWFPSLTHVVNESQGRKKNEEIIAKVTNWSTGKQHTPLKNLLGDANLETKPKSPSPRENKAPVIQKDDTSTKENEALITTVSSILDPEGPNAEYTKRETGKEPNSPARYPADIKREKRKVKGRPYWVQFVCCSSAN